MLNVSTKNLILREATYLGEKPNKPSFHIDYRNEKICYAVASFEYTPEGYELRFIGDRPFTDRIKDLDYFMQFAGICQKVMDSKYELDYLIEEIDN